MLEFTLHHPLRCSVDRFWTLFFDPAFTREMIVDGLGFASCDIDPIRDEGAIRRRDMRVTPKLDLPAAVAKLLGPRLGYTEHGRYTVATQSWSYDLILSVLSERIRMGGTVTVDGEGDRCTRHSKLWVEVRILGLGGLVERAAEKNMRDGWNKAAEWVNGWLDRHPA